MYDLDGYARQVNEKNNLLQDLKDQIEQHCKTIDQKDKEIKRHKREKDDVRKEVIFDFLQEHLELIQLSSMKNISCFPSG